MNPFHTLRDQWEGVPHIADILARNLLCLTVSGENAIHARGFFPDLAQAIRSLGENRFWLLDFEGSEHFVEFSIFDTEEEYFGKLGSAPEWAPGHPFPYAVCFQGFIGGGSWLLLSDRDGERMYFILRNEVPIEPLARAVSLIWNRPAVTVTTPR